MDKFCSYYLHVQWTVTWQHKSGGKSAFIMLCVCVFVCNIQTGSREDDSPETTAETDGPQQDRGDTFQITKVIEDLPFTHLETNSIIWDMYVYMYICNHTKYLLTSTLQGINWQTCLSKEREFFWRVSALTTGKVVTCCKNLPLSTAGFGEWQWYLLLRASHMSSSSDSSNACKWPRHLQQFSGEQHKKSKLNYRTWTSHQALLHCGTWIRG